MFFLLHGIIKLVCGGRASLIFVTAEREKTIYIYIYINTSAKLLHAPWGIIQIINECVTKVKSS